MSEKIKQFLLLIRIDKPIGFLLLLWPTLWGLWLASDGKPYPSTVLKFIVGVFLMRAAGCVINDIADRKKDKFVERTKNRPITSGKISVHDALIFFLILSVLAFLIVLTFNPLTIWLSFVGLALAVVYPFLKRITHLPQLGLGLAFAWGIPMAYAAEINTLNSLTWELFAAAVIWPVIYDTEYAMVDKKDDLRIGIKSTAILFGRLDRFIIGLLQILFISIFIHLGTLLFMPLHYYLFVLAAAILFCYQQYLLKEGNYFAAFMNNAWVGFLIFLGML